MNRSHAAYALLVTQIGFARYLTLRAGDIRARDRLREDLGLDAFDVALIAVDLQTRLEIEISLDRLRQTSTVNDFATCVALAIREQCQDAEPEEARASWC